MAGHFDASSRLLGGIVEQRMLSRKESMAIMLQFRKMTDTTSNTSKTVVAKGRGPRNDRARTKTLFKYPQ